MFSQSIQAIAPPWPGAPAADRSCRTIAEVDHPERGKYRTVEPYRGQSDQAVRQLSQLGYSAAQIALLRAEQVI
ncbi:MAG: hypothetical protein H7335_12755 [Massilia sp.]|nr:hypothetical protein [Massilia sp.]